MKMKLLTIWTISVLVQISLCASGSTEQIDVVGNKLSANQLGFSSENLKNERRMLKLTRKRKRNNNNDSSIFKKLSTYLGDGIPIFIETVQQQRHQVSKRENITW